MQCTDDLMKVDIVLLEDNIDPSSVYLEGMKGYPEPKCQPIISDHVARFQLSLLDFYECGVTRVVYKLNVRIFDYFGHLRQFAILNFHTNIFYFLSNSRVERCSITK